MGAHGSAVRAMQEAGFIFERGIESDALLPSSC
jgi:hypothetical protein